MMDRVQKMSLYTAYNKVVVDVASHLFVDVVDPASVKYDRRAFDMSMAMRCPWYILKCSEKVKQSLFEGVQASLEAVVFGMITIDSADDRVGEQ
jgi:hypothetical protein